MRGLFLAAALATALFAASVALAASGGRAHNSVGFRAAATRTAARSLGFELDAQISGKGEKQPYGLTAIGATGASAEHVHVKVADMWTPDGSKLDGPTADEETDGTFLYFRSTVTRQSLGDLWVRERLATVAPKAPELALLHQVSPAAVLRALGDATNVSTGASPRVFHATLPYGRPGVRSALGGLEGQTQFRSLQLTAWTNADGLIRLVVISGRTADRSSTFLLTLALRNYDSHVAVTPPREGNFVDFDLSKLAA